MSQKASGEIANIYKPEDNEPEVIGNYLVLVYKFILIKQTTSLSTNKNKTLSKKKDYISNKISSKISEKSIYKIKNRKGKTIKEQIEITLGTKNRKRRNTTIRRQIVKYKNY